MRTICVFMIVRVSAKPVKKEEPVEDARLKDYDYLVTMALIRLSQEEVDKLLKERDTKINELNVLRGKSETDLWNDDLAAFMDALDVSCQRTSA
jgi:DNA topoisomerase-2